MCSFSQPQNNRLYFPDMRWHLLPVLLIAGTLHAANLADFTNVTAGHYQVLAQSGLPMASQVNGFMNEMLRHYSRYFSNWTFKDASRVVVFESLADFRAYAQSSIGVTHLGLAGYCHLKTDEDGNSFYELCRDLMRMSPF